MSKNIKKLDEKWYEIVYRTSDDYQVEYQQEISFKACSLENRIDDYIKWYSKNILAKSDKNVREIEKQKVRDFIDKMAIWYELRYPDLKVDNLDSFNTLLDNFSYSNFYNNLSDEEKYFLTNYIYPKLVYFDEKSGRHFQLSEDGIVLLDEYSRDKLKFKGKNIEDVQKYLKESGISSYELDKVVSDYKNNSYKKEGLLNSVMYKLIENGGISGSKRAFLFAKEFNRDLSIPIKYMITEDNLVCGLDNNTKLFINEYLRLNGSLYLSCYPNYHIKNKNVGVISLIDIIENYPFYLGEDKNIIKLRLLNILKNVILKNNKELENDIYESSEIEEVKSFQKKIER